MWEDETRGRGRAGGRAGGWAGGAAVPNPEFRRHVELELAPLHVVLDLSLLKALSDMNDGSDAAAGRQVGEGE